MFLLYSLIFIVGMVVSYNIVFNVILPRLEKSEEVNPEELKKSKDQLKEQVDEAEKLTQKQIKKGKKDLKKLKEIKK